MTALHKTRKEIQETNKILDRVYKKVKTYDDLLETNIEFLDQRTFQSGTWRCKGSINNLLTAYKIQALIQTHLQALCVTDRREGRENV